jgi:hypothetical protein
MEDVRRPPRPAAASRTRALTHFRTAVHSPFTLAISASMDFFASPKSISVLGL